MRAYLLPFCCLMNVFTWKEIRIINRCRHLGITNFYRLVGIYKCIVLSICSKIHCYYSYLRFPPYLTGRRKTLYLDLFDIGTNIERCVRENNFPKRIKRSCEREVNTPYKLLRSIFTFVLLPTRSDGRSRVYCCYILNRNPLT